MKTNTSKAKGYLVKTVENCNSSEDVTNKVFKNYDKAKSYFNEQVEDLVKSYMEDEESLEDWLDSNNGIIITEYCGKVTDTYVAFDCNEVELVELD